MRTKDRKCTGWSYFAGHVHHAEPPLSLGGCRQSFPSCRSLYIRRPPYEPDDPWADHTIPAVCVSIGRILQNTAPICCLSFDGIGVRHPGMTRGAAARSPACSTFPLSCHRQAKNLIFPFAFRSEVLLVSCGSRGGYALGFCGRSTCGETDAGVPGCRIQIRSKGKQRVGAVSCGIRSIETQIAVIRFLIGRYDIDGLRV